LVGCAAVFFPSRLSEATIEGLLAAVGGIMAFLVLHEMLPLAFDYAGHKPAVVAVFLGMALMSVRYAPPSPQPR
jgi:ZIP family zinc transporter